MKKSPSAVMVFNARKGERLYAVGDIHGCYDELIALEKKLTEACARAGVKSWRLISVGDLCDRGPATRQVIEHFVAGHKRGTHHAILGNHESFFLLAFAGLRPDLVAAAGVKTCWFHKVILTLFSQLSRNMDIWKRNGGAAVFQSYGVDIDKPSTWDQIPLSHISFIFNASLSAKTPKAFITHALAAPGDYERLKEMDKSAEEPGPEAGELVTRILWERIDPKTTLIRGLRHVSGHTPLEAVRRVKNLGMIQIDTGAVYGRSLTALDLSSFRTISVRSSFNAKDIDEKYK